MQGTLLMERELGYSVADGQVSVPGSCIPRELLEILVHLQETAFLSSYVIFQLDFSDTLVQELDPASLPSNWRVSPAPPATLAIGDDWIRNSSSAVLRVPSVIVPSEYNFLINPAHRDFSGISIGSPNPLDVDHRLLRK
jgi:RES domain-containing protein